MTLSKEPRELTTRIVELLREDSGQMVKDLVKRLSVNRTFLASYLKALENQRRLKSKKIGPAKIYFIRLRI